jgi:MG2 domain
MRTRLCTQSTAALIVLMVGLSAVQAGTVSAGSITDQVLLQIQPSSNTINAGAFAKFAMHVIENTSSDVYLVAIGVPPDGVAIFTPNVGVANPSFNSSLTIVTSADTPPGNYVVTAVAIVNGTQYTRELSLQILALTSVTTSTNTTVNSSLGTTLSMTVSTDQPQYQPNSTANIQGQVTDATGGAVAGAAVSIQVDAPTGAEAFSSDNIHTDSAGTFQVQVSLGSDSPTGTYTVFASATKPGYSSVTTRTTFVVGTSTTPSVIIKAVYAGDSSGNPMSTFTAGQTIWVWVVIENIGATFQGVVWIQVRDPSGVPVQIQIHIARLDAGETTKDGLGFTLLEHPTIGVYTVNALVSDKLISQGGIFLASSETQFALIG